jgi:hypothetical protein
MHDGVTLRSYDVTQNLAKLPEARRAMAERMAPGGTQRSYVAVFDQLGVLVTGGNGEAAARRAIDAARGKAPRFVAGATFAALLAASKAQKDSVVMMMDVNGIIAGATGRPPAAATAVTPVVMSFGFADQAAHARIALPSATMRAVMSSVAP